MTSRAWLLLPLGLLAACDSPTPAPDLAILDVIPLAQKTNESKTVRVHLNADPAFLVDYDTPRAQQVDAPVLKLGAQTVPLTYLGQGLFEGVVGPMTRGNHPVAVSLDGREATFAAPYVVTAPVSFNYEFASISPQVRGQPFTVTVTVTARGQVAGEPVAPRTAELKVFSGSREFFTATTLPFTPGKLSQQITIDHTGDDFVARLEDSEGARAYSNAFPVAPPMQ